MPLPLTELERRVLDYVVEYLRANTYQPSVREIGRRFGIKSTKTVSELLRSLAEKGWVERDPARSRGVRLLQSALPPRTVSVPQIDAESDGEAPPLELDRRLAGNAGAFLIAMPDDALNSDGVRAGDLLLAEPVLDGAVDDGDLVVCLANGTRTVRRYLHSRSDSGIEGRVISIVRQIRSPRAAALDPSAEPA